MTYYSKKNLKDYKLNDSTRDNKLKYSVPLYNSNKIQLSSSGSKGMLTTSNFSNNDRKDPSSKKKSQLLKWSTSQIKYKNKKNDSNTKSSSSKYSASYSSKRPKSAKGTGINSKHDYIYKYSMHKGNSSSKYTSSSKKRNDTSSQLRKNQPIKDITSKAKKDYMTSSYRKSNISGTHKKYAKTSRGGKKSSSSNSKLMDQGSYSNKFTTSKTANKKSYNSIMTMLINKEQDMYRTTTDERKQATQASRDSGLDRVHNYRTSTSNSKLFNTSTRAKNGETPSYKSTSKEPKSFKKSEVTLYTSKAGEKEIKKELEGYLKTSRSRTSRNYLTHNSNAHLHKTHR